MREGESIESSAVEWRVGAVFWMALIFTLSSELFAPKFSFGATLDWFGTLNYLVRKFAHAVEFAVLAWLLFRSLYPRPFTVGIARIWAVLLSLLYAASDEYHQSFVPMRSGKATDVMFDAAGILVVAHLIGRATNEDEPYLLRQVFGFPSDRSEDNG